MGMAWLFDSRNLAGLAAAQVLHLPSAAGLGEFPWLTKGAVCLAWEPDTALHSCR